MRRLTDLDKLECAEYVLDILQKALNRDGPFSTAHGLWMERAKQDMDKIRGQYLVVDTPLAPKGEENE